MIFSWILAGQRERRRALTFINKDNPADERDYLKDNVDNHQRAPPKSQRLGGEAVGVKRAEEGRGEGNHRYADHQGGDRLGDEEAVIWWNGRTRYGRV